jgi:hypothetical protein
MSETNPKMLSSFLKHSAGTFGALVVVDGS